MESRKPLKKATFSLYLFSCKNGPGEVSIYELGKPIEESAIWPWYKTGAAWSTPGGDYDENSPLSTIDIGANETEKWLHFDVPLDMAKAYLNGSKPFNGFFVKAQSQQVYLYFRSSEFNWEEYRPKLTFDFEGGIAIESTLSPMSNASMILARKVLTIPNANQKFDKMSVIDMSGRLLFSKALEDGENRITLPTQSGVYILSLNGSDESFNSRIVVP